MTWNAAKVRGFRESFEEFMTYVVIDSKEMGRMILGDHIYRAQRMFLDTVWDALSEDIHDIYILKSRQLGLSTVARALGAFWLGVHDGLRGSVVFDTGSNADEARSEIGSIIARLPKSFKFPREVGNNRTRLRLENGSQSLFMSAGRTNARSGGGLGRSVGINFSHACMAPGTPVVVGDGIIKRIEDVSIGDYVLTHGGNYATVIANVGQPNTKKTMYEITPWLGQAVSCTGDHKIPTQRGMVRADELLKTDRLIMPIRPIYDEIDAVVLPDTPTRVQRGGRVSVGSGQTVALDEEFGFFVGYYLAEGYIILQPQRGNFVETPKPAGFIFARHRNEKPYADRAFAAVSHVISSRTTVDDTGTFRSTERIYGASLAQWMNDNFGRVGTKRIPDEVFKWGKPFCTGLIAGLLCGDGSKTASVVNRNPPPSKARGRQRNPRKGRTERNDGTPINRIHLTSIRSSIAMQLRDLVASCGLGWGAIKERSAGVYYGRNCKQAWTLTWLGGAAASLRHLIGLSVVVNRRSYVDKYEIIGTSVYVKIRKIGESVVDFMYDLSVDHVDHTFRTPYFAVSNSEISSWVNEEGIASYKRSLAEDFPDRLYLWESTARGYDSWHALWQEARLDDISKRCAFFGWWAKDNHEIARGTREFERYGLAPPSERELVRIRAVKEQYGWSITPEQLAWFRKMSDPSGQLEGDDAEDSLITQEEPWTEEDAFQQTGSTFFQPETLTKSANRIQTLNQRPQQFKFIAGNDFVSCDIMPAKTRRATELFVWEEPVTDGCYIVAGDPAFGRDERNNHSAVSVLRGYADAIEQVAEYASPLCPPHHFAWLLLSLVGWYGGTKPGCKVLLICELNGPGEEVWRQYQQSMLLVQRGYLRRAAQERGIADIYTNARSYVYTRSDTMAQGHNWQFKSTVQNKVQIMEATRNYLHSGTLVVNSMEALSEMRAISRDGDKIGAEGRNRDDRTFTLALGVRAWEEKLRRTLISGNRTRQAERARVSLSAQDRRQVYETNMLQSFFQRKERERILAARQQRSNNIIRFPRPARVAPRRW